MCVDMLENCAIPKLENLQPNIMLQLNDAPSHWRHFFHDGGVEYFQNVWISHRGPKTLLRLLFCLGFWEALG